MIKNILKGLIVILAVLVVGFVFGPKVERPNLDMTLPNVPKELTEIEKYISAKEAKVTNLREDNEARIVWFDSIPKRTEYSILYLHGWSASWKEGDPVHQVIAKRFGCNLFLPRLADHGIKEKEPLLNITAVKLWNSAKEALAIAKQMGNKVIIMSTSTGGTLALKLAAEDPDIAALILYSPNIEIYDASSKVLSKPWGLQLARLVQGSNYHQWDPEPGTENYWTNKYRLEALTHLQALVETTMKSKTFEAVTVPTFMGYYYKNNEEQDMTVSVPAMIDMFNQLGTPEVKKHKRAFPNTGDHVIASPLTSNDVVAVQEETIKFFEEVLGLKKVAVPVAEKAQLPVE